MTSTALLGVGLGGACLAGLLALGTAPSPPEATPQPDPAAEAASADRSACRLALAAAESSRWRARTAEARREVAVLAPPVGGSRAFRENLRGYVDEVLAEIALDGASSAYAAGLTAALSVPDVSDPVAEALLGASRAAAEVGEAADSTDRLVPALGAAASADEALVEVCAD